MAEPAQAVVKLAAMLRIVKDQRQQHVDRHPGMTGREVFSHCDMKEIIKQWLNHYRTWMSSDTVNQYERYWWNRRQQAHQCRQSAFSNIAVPDHR